ncbi:hypothetical protein ACFLZX_03320 [Nanoarchaeota archaeon]
MANNVSKFHKEILEIVRNSISLNKFFVEKDIDEKIKRIETVISEFNKKYPLLKLSFSKTMSRMELIVSFRGYSDVVAFFNDVVVSIPGLKTIGVNTFDEVEVSNQDNVKNLMNKVKQKIFVSFTSPESGSTGFILSLHKKNVQIEFDPTDFDLKGSPLLNVLSTIALKESNPNIDIFKKTGHIGFTDLLSEEELKKEIARYHPKWRE